MKEARTLKVVQIKSGIGFPARQKRILRSLGLGKMHRTVLLPDNSAVRGMVRAIPHLVRIETDSNDTPSGEAS